MYLLLCFYFSNRDGGGGGGGNSHWKSHHPILTNYIINISTDMKLCLAPTIHKFKCMKITYISLIWYQAFATIDV